MLQLFDFHNWGIRNVFHIITNFEIYKKKKKTEKNEKEKEIPSLVIHLIISYSKCNKCLIYQIKNKVKQYC